MSAIALILLLLAATAGLRLIADRAHIPLPTLLVIGGLCLALIPGLPQVTLDPHAIFLIFIPPLLFWAAINSSLRDLVRNLRSITLLAVVMVVATTFIVAYAAHALLPQLPLAVCFVLGAIVSPPDAVAVTASTRQLSLPRTTLVILEGESLMNDATALVAYQLALAAAVSGRFSAAAAGVELVLTGAGGILIGLIAGYALGWLRKRIPPSGVVENTLSLLSPFVAYVPADAAHCSGVLAVVAMGLYLGRAGPRVVSAATRLQAVAMWEMLTFWLEGLIFIFVGLQLPQVVRALAPSEIAHLTWVALAVVAAMIGIRMTLIFPGAYVPRLIEARFGDTKPSYPPVRNILFGGWAGIRGGDSLVIALALPFTVAGGAPLAGRNAVIFITFVVILVTLVVQGLTLAPVIRLLGVVGDNEEEREEHKARRASIAAASEAIERYIARTGKEPVSAPELRAAAARELKRLRNPPRRPPEDLAMRLEVIAAQREAVITLRDRDEISDTVMRRLQIELDHEELVLRQRFE
ncbi:MAG TPA: Na+/H+ antiporter [Steroidobacteraceae bacterium]|jgi:CPA1 family monovalent cation:H+ antiporter|nr:Na+/H+ antiporter [Steroidobacteraceae bacterium]